MIDPLEMMEHLMDQPWSDGLPLVPPTEAAIEKMLAGTRRPPDEELGEVPPLGGMASVYQIALHAVMAGCKPAYMPCLIAGVEAVLEPRFNLLLVQATSSAAAPLLVFSGPHAKEIGLHGGEGCLGPGFRANATIGRALRLLMFNLGGGYPGAGATSCFGGPARFTFCLAENEAESPFESYAAARGITGNAVAAIPCEPPIQVWDDASKTPERLLRTIGDTMSTLGGGNIYRRADLTVILSPQHANVFAAAGMTRADVHTKLIEASRRKLGEIRDAGIWRGASGAARWHFEVDLNDDDALIPAVGRPEDLHLFVAGGKNGPCSLVMHGMTEAARGVVRGYGG
ncbi:MAG: hypothetical protein O2807_01575 [bacterium]|nr:hypothetical protein [bacterium]